MGQIEHSIRQTFTAPFRLFSKPDLDVGVAQRIGDMIESIEMLRKCFDCAVHSACDCQNVCDSEFHDGVSVRWARMFSCLNN